MTSETRISRDDDAACPLVTYAVMVYNQEEFVHAAVTSALAQTYSPLEILISDDASTDNSAEVCREIVDSYNGPHKVRLNVNTRNLGIGSHVNQLFRQAHGGLILLAGGDDVARPNRTHSIVRRWVETGKGASAIYSGARRIDRNGTPLGHIDTELQTGRLRAEHLIMYKHIKRPLAIGACGAYSAEVMDRFGDLDPELPIEDIPLLVRASMLDGVEYVAEDLVDYRISVSVWRERKLDMDTFAKRLSRRRFYTLARLKVANQVLEDSITSKNLGYIRAANRAYLLHDYVYRCCERQKMAWRDYFTVGLATGNWLYSLAAALMDGHPRIHSLLYELKAFAQTTKKRFSRRGK